MQYVFLICSSAGCKKYVTMRTVSIFIANLHAILTTFYAQTMGLSFVADVVWHHDSERVSHGACS